MKLTPLRKKVSFMKLFAENGYYEVMYKNRCYPFLEFIRIDTICERTYVTLKNIITGEIFTFEEEKVTRIRKKLLLRDIKLFHYNRD